MILQAIIYSIFVEVFISIVGWIFPNLFLGLYGGLFAMLIAPFVAGYIIYTQYDLDMSKSIRWSYSSVFSFLQTASAVVFILYYLGTPGGIALLAKSNVQPGSMTNIIYLLCFVFLFLVLLFSNRIGFGLGIRYGNFTKSINDKVALKMET